jgi:hypothetical protein
LAQGPDNLRDWPHPRLSVLLALSVCWFDASYQHSIGGVHLQSLPPGALEFKHLVAIVVGSLITGSRPIEWSICHLPFEN